MKKIIFSTIIAALLLNANPIFAAYDPLAIDKTSIEKQDMVIRDERRSRDIPIRVYLPSSKVAAPVVIFSHGLGGSRENNPYLGNHWAARGYVVVFIQHAGSDEAVWKDLPAAERVKALVKAASLENFLLRVHDVPAVIDQLERWNKLPTHPLYDKMDLQHIGMSGHSFGATTTQAVSGQHFTLVIGYTDARIKAAVMMSPSSPRLGGNPKSAFSEIKQPWMLLTGTNDNSPIGDADAKSRLAVYPALPPGDKYELVLDKAEHSAFGDRPLPGDSETRKPNHHRAILAATTAFWDEYLRDDTDAKKWLESEQIRGVLEKDDKWQHK